MLGLGLATSKGGFVDALAEVTNTKSIIFDGGDEYVDCGNAIVTSYPFTVAGWLKPTLNNGLQVLTLSDVSASNVYYSIAWNSSNVFQLQARNTSIKKISSQTYGSLGGWYHIVGVFTSATDRTLYVNGVKDHSGEENLDSVTFNSNIDTTTLGALNRPSPAYGTGNLDEIAIWNDSLTANEVTQIYNSNKATLDLSTDTGDYSSSANLKGWWRMGDEASTRVVDDNANNLVIPDMRKTFFSGKSIGFDDSNDYIQLGSEIQLTGEFSISTWVKFDSDTFDDSGNNQILGSSSGSGYLNIYNLNRLRIQTDSATSFLGFFDSSYTMTSDTWHHIVVTRDSSNDIRVYIDGQSRLSSAVSNSGTFDFDYIARSSSSGYFGGNLCDIAIYNTELNADTVASIYNSGEPNNLLLSASYTAGSGIDKTANLQAYYRMGNGTIDDFTLIGDQTDTSLQSNIIDTTKFFREEDGTSGGWTPYGSNSVSVTSDSVTIAYGSHIFGAKITFKQTGSNSCLTENLVVDQVYKFSCTISSLTDNDSDMKLNVTGASETSEVLSNGDAVIYFRASHATSNIFRLNGLDSGETVTISNPSLQKVNGNAGIMTNMSAFDIVDHAPNRNSGDMINFDATADIETDTP
tara:strand:- start:1630 stop:3528 length:1899 start_codon:yes stop_codon:yes gene_type:complete